MIYVNFVKILIIVAMVTMLGWPGTHALLRRVLTKRHFYGITRLVETQN